MAKIMFEMDTVEKTYKLMLDGKQLDNAMELKAYLGVGGDGDKASCVIYTAERLEDDGLYKYTKISAGRNGIETQDVVDDELAKEVGKVAFRRR